MVADATVRQTRMLQAISVDDLHKWFNLRRRPPSNPLVGGAHEDDSIYIESQGVEANILNPLATYSASHDRSESGQHARRLNSLDITPWGAGDAKRPNGDLYEPPARKTISTAKEPTRAALSLAEVSAGIDDVVIHVGERDLVEAYRDPSPIYIDKQ